VLGVDECRHAARPLDLGHRVQREGGLAAGLGPVDFDHTATRVAPDAERQIEAHRPAAEGLDFTFDRVVGHRKDRALAELLLDGGDGDFDRLLLV